MKLYKNTINGTIVASENFNKEGFLFEGTIVDSGISERPTGYHSKCWLVSCYEEIVVAEYNPSQVGDREDDV